MKASAPPSVLRVLFLIKTFSLSQLGGWVLGQDPLNLPPYATGLDRPAIFWIRSDRSTDPITSYSTSVTRGISETQQLIQLIFNTKLAPRRNVEIYPTSFVSNDCENNFSHQMR